MKKEFVPYEIAIFIEENGGISKTFGSWYKGSKKNYISTNEEDYNNIDLVHLCPAPLYQQAFRWLFENFKDDVENYYSNISLKWLIGDIEVENAKDVCLRKLIEICQEKTK